MARTGKSAGRGVWALGLAGAMVLSASAQGQQELLLQNDSLRDGDVGAIQLGFVNNEIGAARYTPSPDLFPMKILRIQILWYSRTQNTGQSEQDSLVIYTGNIPNPSFVAAFDSPVLTDGFLNEFDISGEEIIIEEPTSIIVGMRFLDAPNGDPFKPSLVTDVNGCQFGKNPLLAIPGGWRDLCSFGASGDFVIRTVVQPMGQECVPDIDGDGDVDGSDFLNYLSLFFNGSARADLNEDGLVDGADFLVFLSAFFEGC